MSWAQTYAKEIISILIPFIAWTLNTLSKGKTRLQTAHTHVFTFLVQEPLINQQGVTVAATQVVHTKSIIVRNVGRETATKVELVFNWKPMYLNIWPVRHFEEHIET